jgi:hypothetical protein
MPFANRWFIVAFACVSLGACAASPRPVLSVAEYDLSCPQVEVSRIDDNHYAASGCGRGAVYVQSCDDGAGCRWARMRHGHEVDVAAAQAPLYGTPAPREVIAAPPPAQREVLPAPAPGSPEVVPAPAPDATSGGEAPAPDAAPAPASSTTPVQEDQLSQPYQAEVPAVPAAQRVQYAPPAPIVETRPAPPQVTYIWVGGYWWWGDWGWTWVPGYWAPPRRGFVWVGGGWYWYSSMWWYYPGGWCYPGSRVVVYAPAPRPQRVVTVRTIRPHSVSSSPAVASRAPRSGAAVSPRAPVASAPAPVRSAASASSFRPRESPLMHYPAPTPSATGRLTPRPHASAIQPSGQPGGRGGSASLGRVVRPTETVPPRSNYGSRGNPSSRFDYSRPSSSPGRFDRTPSTGSRSVAPSSRAPSRVSPAKPPPSSFRVPSRGSAPSRGSMPSRGGSPSRSGRPR